MPTRCATAEEIADHDRDLRKHEDPAGINAREIAILVKNLKNIDDAAALIDQYAKTVAAGARLEGVEQAYSRMDAVLR